ncbi:MAG: putative prophage CPS-53 integrase [Candidatus Accumulibacter adjunctus]|uniref:Prophage CPS-53 integrase n=1 Tax=Candidatus Accumulibacter adjunctus TaxID=1454001 RepID=A0A011NTM6_9PROT|nr:MAG: putative prophage CPS-53 integrase [Candidatus Accumulibacter adjunctus]
MGNDIFPGRGAKPIVERSALDVLGVLRRIDERGAHYTSHRVRSEISRVFRYAIATGRAERDPCPELRGAIPAPKGERVAATGTSKEVAELLRAIDGFRGTFAVKSALLLAPLLFVRPSELAQPGNAGVRGLRHRALHVEMEHRLASAPLLAQSPPARVARARRAVAVPVTGRNCHTCGRHVSASGTGSRRGIRPSPPVEDAP